MTEAVAWMYERRPEAYPPTKMIVALERRLDIPELQFWTETPLYPAEADQGGWIVGNGDGTKWRTWGAMGPEWTTDRNTATRYYRREDAEAVHRDDEDAWTIVPFGDQAPQASTEAAWCDDTLPCARYTEALRARDERIAELEGEKYVAFTDGMEAAAEICGSLAETTYDDTDAFEAATGCEAEIMLVVKQKRREQDSAAALKEKNDG